MSGHGGRFSAVTFEEGVQDAADSVSPPPLLPFSYPTPLSYFDELGLEFTDNDSAGFPFNVPDFL